MITTILIFKTNALSPIKDYRWLYNSISRLYPTFIFSSTLVPTQLYDSVTTHLRPGKQVKYRFFRFAIKTERRPTGRDCGDVPYGECTGSEYALCAYEHLPPDGECGPLTV